jgi:phage replication-related protein YjqB (UPF0714/DUF867 family)
MHTDKYRSLDELKTSEPASAWAQSSCDRKSWLTVVAPHGGCIEPFTTAIAVGIAGDEHNLFVFEGRLGANQGCYARLHVTSTNFRDADLTYLQEYSEMTLSIHGAQDSEDEADPRITWIGGRNEPARIRIDDCLTAGGFITRQAHHGQSYAGVEDENFVNIPRDGVQLEISAMERAALKQDKQRFLAYISSVRSALVGMND